MGLGFSLKPYSKIGAHPVSISWKAAPTTRAVVAAICDGEEVGFIVLGARGWIGCTSGRCSRAVPREEAQRFVEHWWIVADMSPISVNNVADICQ